MEIRNHRVTLEATLRDAVSRSGRIVIEFRTENRSEGLKIVLAMHRRNVLVLDHADASEALSITEHGWEGSETFRPTATIGETVRDEAKLQALARDLALFVIIAVAPAP